MLTDPSNFRRLQFADEQARAAERDMRIVIWVNHRLLAQPAKIPITKEDQQ